MDNWSKKIVGIKVQGFLYPSSCTDRRRATIECLKAEPDEIIVKVGDETLSTNDAGYVNYGRDRIATAICQLCEEILVIADDDTNEWTGYLHNYKFANGRIYDETNPIHGFYIVG